MSIQIRTTDLIDYVSSRQDNKEFFNDYEAGMKFLRSLAWKVHSSELVWGEYVRISYVAKLSSQEASEFYRHELSQIGMFQTEHTTDGGILIVARRIIKPEDLGNATKFSNTDPCVESWSIPAPDGVEYFDFQRASIWELIQRPVALLGDDMGLGKTIQACGMLNYIQPERVVVVAPAGMKNVWKAELEKWLTYEIPVRVVNAGMESYRKGRRGVFVTNYEALRSNDARKFIEDDWDQVILDESHRIKNEKSQTARAILGGVDENGNEMRGLQAPRKLLLSGTPMPNRGLELWTTFSYLYPNVFTPNLYQDFKSAFQGRGSRHYVSNSTYLKNWFRAITIRRRKATTLEGLPPKKRTTKLVSVNAENMTRLHDMENKALADAFGGWGQSIEFTQWSAIRAECARIKCANNAEYVIKFLIRNPKKKLVVFRHHEVTRRALSEALKIMDIPHVYYEGGMSQDKKFDAVEKFQNDPNCKVIIVSIKAGGLGITLTAAQHAVFTEIDCVPSSLLQCEDRLHRISQQKNVDITYLYVHGSIEEYMAHIVAAKIPQIEKVVDDDDVDPEHLVEAEVNIVDILKNFQEDQKGWDRLRDIHWILRTSTNEDGYGGMKRKYSDYIVSRFEVEYPEFRKGESRQKRGLPPLQV